MPNVTYPFRFFCQKVLPLVYDDSLSYYELLCKVVDYINKLIESDVELSGGLLDLKNKLETYMRDQNERIEEIVDQVIVQYFEEHPEVVIPDSGVTFEKLNEDLQERYFDAGYVKYYFPFLTDESGSGYSGSCALAVTSQGKTCLFDCGPTSDWDAIKDYFDDLYEHDKFTNIDYIFISHYHGDHVQNLASILATYPHAGCKAYIAPTAEHMSYNTTSGGVTTHHTWDRDCKDYYNGVKTALTAASVPFTEVQSDTEIVVDGDLTIDLWNTTPSDYQHYDDLTNCYYNNYSMIAFLTVRNSYACFPGDIQREAQKWTLPQHPWQKLAVYAVHHHAIQNDDFIPFLDTIDPDISVVSTSHNRALVTGASSFAVNWFEGLVTSTAYNKAEITQGANGAVLTYGDPLNRVGWEYSDVEFYVDNTYSGQIHDGTEDYPFTQINEAISHMKENGHFRYYIYVRQTNTIYSYVWAHNVTSSVQLRPWILENEDQDQKPKVVGFYVRGCTDFDIAGFNIMGSGRSLYSRRVSVYAEASVLRISNCILSGALMTTDNVHTAITVSLATVYVTGCSFTTYHNAIDGYLFGTVFASGNTFEACSSSCYDTRHLDLYLDSADTLTIPENAVWILCGTSTPSPVKLARNVISSENIDYLDADFYSAPFYRSESHPLVIMVGPHMYEWTDALSEVTVS